MRIPSATIITLLTLSQGTNAFFVQPNSVVRKYDTSISAVAPTLVIGPMIRKMREEKEKKKMPMAAADEAALEAPGLRVGKCLKWPPVWPYDETSFVPKVDEVPLPRQTLHLVANMVTGATPVPSPVTVSDKDKLDPLKYWEKKGGRPH
ncbi:methyltransferase domain-containing protein [Fragilaria crotonensis]|nr:methyltransferase domain-containing protein [Fragilaria crotonensis]